MKEGIVTEEVIEAEAAPERRVKEESEAVVEETIVTEEVLEAQAAPGSPDKNETRDCCERSSCNRRSYRS